MSRMVKEFIEIRDLSSLDELIRKLSEIRETLPDPAQAEVRMRGDEVFGRQLTVSYFRPQTAEEADCEARYANAYRESRERELTRLQDELGFCPVRQRQPRKLRIVA
ncbi:MAG TPA: hypothetical protein VN231_10300 [Allosphingosinicella sp.]|nr:hypothetical protein [Allosphingosinicella sp.]